MSNRATFLVLNQCWHPLVTEVPHSYLDVAHRRMAAADPSADRRMHTGIRRHGHKLQELSHGNDAELTEVKVSLHRCRTLEGTWEHQWLAAVHATQDSARRR